VSLQLLVCRPSSAQFLDAFGWADNVSQANPNFRLLLPTFPWAISVHLTFTVHGGSPAKDESISYHPNPCDFSLQQISRNA